MVMVFGFGNCLVICWRCLVNCMLSSSWRLVGLNLVWVIWLLFLCNVMVWVVLYLMLSSLGMG